MANEKEEKKEIEVGFTPTFTERIATAILVAHTPEGLFVFDFMKPIVTAVADEKGNLRGFRGTMKSDVRIYLTPITVKRLLKVLEKQIKEYERKFGPIKLPEEKEEEI